MIAKICEQVARGRDTHDRSDASLVDSAISFVVGSLNKNEKKKEKKKTKEKEKKKRTVTKQITFPKRASKDSVIVWLK